jgi:branched-chain amino acid transport system permease protein
MFWQQLVNGITIGSIYALIALGLTMVYSVLRVLHIAHAGIYAFGAYAGVVSFRLTGSFWLSLILAMLMSAGAGLLVQHFIYAPLLSRSRIVPLIASIGLFTALEEVFRIIWGPYVLPYPAQSGLKAITIGDIRITENQVLIVVITFPLLAILWFIMNKTKLGLAMRATSQDMEIVSTMGINADRIVAVNFLIGSALAGAAGVLVGIYFNSVYPTMGAIPAYKALAIIVLGGLGSVPGAVIAAVFIGLSETLLMGMLTIPLPRDALAFIILIAVLMFRPYGLLGKK